MALILVVEDDKNHRNLLEQELAEDGYEVMAASNGAAAMEIFKINRPALVIMDILLPGIDGIDVMQQMLEIEPQLPIIIHTAYSSPSSDFITWFAKAYVIKSTDLSGLKEEVRKSLEQVGV